MGESVRPTSPRRARARQDGSANQGIEVLPAAAVTYLPGTRMSRGHRDYFASITALSESRRDELVNEARESIARQRDIEARDDIDFDEYLSRYFAADY